MGKMQGWSLRLHLGSHGGEAAGIDRLSIASEQTLITHLSRRPDDTSQM